MGLQDEIWGTPYYVSPERLNRQAEDIRSDIYSLGATLYHALAGRAPFEAATAEEVARRHLLDRPAPLRSLCPMIEETPAVANTLDSLKSREIGRAHV